MKYSINIEIMTFMKHHIIYYLLLSTNKVPLHGLLSMIELGRTWEMLTTGLYLLKGGSMKFTCYVI